MSTVYVITGANRGIGRGLAEIVASRPNHTIYALVRDPSHETSQSLLKHSTATNSSIKLARYDASDPSSALQAVNELQSTYNVTKVDTVIANAGAIGAMGVSTELSASDFQDLFTTNTVGPIMLFNAMLPLLRNGLSPRFVAISSAIGSTTMIAKGRSARGLPYGMSKAALNHAICKLNRDEGYSNIAFGLFTPGPTRTGFGGAGFDWDKVPGVQTMDVVVPGLMTRIDEVVKMPVGENPVFKDWKGDVIPW